MSFFRRKPKPAVATPASTVDQAAAPVAVAERDALTGDYTCLLYTSPSPRDGLLSRMPSSA